jgi:hypothetical protein
LRGKVKREYRHRLERRGISGPDIGIEARVTVKLGRLARVVSGI